MMSARVRKYMRNDGKAGADNMRYCAGPGCCFTSAKTQFNPEFWVRHVLVCEAWDDQAKSDVAANHPCSKTGAISGCNDEGEGEDTATSALEEPSMDDLEEMVVDVDVDDFDQDTASPMEQVN